MKYIILLFPVLLFGQINDPIFHFDADTIGLTGSKVSTLYDKSGNGNDFTQTTDANRPTTTTGSVNGASVDFDPTNSHYLTRSTDTDFDFGQAN